jgi:trimethylamine---corrinoid protein Co-methyltransferase
MPHGTALTQVPRVALLDDPMRDRIIDEAYEILSRVGVLVENDEGLALLNDHGADVDGVERRARLPRGLVERALATAPPTFTLWDQPGEVRLVVGGDEVLFNPGSAALNVLDPVSSGSLAPMRRATARDYARLCRLVEQLPHLQLNSTALVCTDAPTELSDAYRLYVALCCCRKPIVTGLFRKEGFAIMHELLTTARGGDAALRARPLAIFDACSSPPLRWSDLTTHSLLRCARAGLPSNIIAMPMAGATGPMSLLGSIVQHTAENLAGVTLVQLASPGAPTIFGGAPAAFDMRHGTTPMGAIETMLLDLGYCEVGRALGLPVQGYLGLSDSKRVDAQAGYETGMGVLLAALARMNIVSGAGILDHITCQSLEKLIIDHELCRMARRLLDGLTPRTSTLGREAVEEVVGGEGNFLGHPTTLQFFRDELSFPGAVVDRTTSLPLEAQTQRTELERARADVERLLGRPGFAPPAEIAGELRRIITTAAGSLVLPVIDPPE